MNVGRFDLSRNKKELACLAGVVIAAFLLVVTLFRELTRVEPVPVRPVRERLALSETGTPYRTLSDQIEANRASLAGASARPAASEPKPDLREANRKLAAENRELKNRLHDILNWILVNFRGKFPLSENHMSKLRLFALNEDFTLHTEVAELLKMTPEEQAQINDLFRANADALMRIEAATLSVRDARPDKVIVSIPAFGEEQGRILREDLYAELEQTLGGPRFDRFLQVTEKNLEENFYHFGKASRTMIFELAYGDDGSSPRLIIRDAWIIPEGENGRAIRAMETTVTNLPSKYLNYLAWLPDYVAGYAAK